MSCARSWLGLVALALVMSGCRNAGKEEVVREITREGEPIRIAAGEIHYRDVNVEAGDYVRVLVDQQGADVVVRLHDPAGNEVKTVDSPNGSQGFEDLVAIVEAGGRHRIEVAVLGEETGHYVLTELVRRPATAEDRDVVEADRLYWEATRHRRQGEHEEAIALYRGTLAVWERAGLVRRRIETLHGLCIAHRARREYPIAVALCEEAIVLYHTQDDRRGLDVVLDRTAWLHLRRGRTERAVTLLEEAVSAFLERGFDRGAALALVKLASVRHQLGGTRGAEEAFQEALERSVTAGDPLTEATVRGELGAFLLDQRRLREAAEQYERVLQIRREQEDEEKLAAALEGVAFTAAQLGDLERASAAIGDAARLARDAPRSTLSSTLGLVRRLQGDLEGARQAYEEALRQARETGSREDERIALARLGELDLEMGEPEAALGRFDEVLALAQAAGDPRWEAAARVHAGRALAALERLPEAWQRIEPALDLVEGLRAGIDRRGARTGYFAFRQDYYEIAVDVLLRLHARDPGAGHDSAAFAVNERRLVRELHEAFARQRSGSQVSRELLAEEKRIEGMLAEAALLPRDDPRREERVRVLIEQLDAVTARIRRAVTATETARPPKVAVEELLDRETLLLAYALGERRSYLWAVSEDGLSVHELPPRAQVENRAAAFVAALTRSSARSRAAIERFGPALSETLLSPVAEQLAKRRRLALVTEGGLQAVPFAALPGADGKPLVRSHEIAVLPSASALSAYRRQELQRPSPSSILIFADPVLGAGDPRLAGREDSPPPEPPEIGGELLRAAESLGFDPFARLPHTGDEAEAVGALHEGAAVVALGFAASRETLMSQDLKRYGVLHFATHALVAPRPELSGLVLSLFDEKGRRRNGFVRAFEIARLDLAAELVVLSACQTGLGEDLPGEGMQGLGRAFLDAGAGRVVYSLWEVGDRSTAELMARFHEALARHGRPAAALREAQLAMLDEDGATPRQWAGFVLLGDWRGFDSRGAAR